MRQFIGVLPAILAIGVAGCVTGAFVGVRYASSDMDFFLVLTSVGAAVAGVCVIPFFGRAGPAGWGLAALGGAVATLLASVALGLILNASYFVIAPMSVVMTLVLQPISALGWIACMGCAHVVMWHWRQRRNSHFLN